MSTSTAIVLSPKVGLMRSLAMSMLGIMAKTDNSRAPFQTKRDRKWDQLVRARDNPNMPLVAWATFTPARSKKDGRPIIETSVEIPDPDGSSLDVRVSARPHILVDGLNEYLPYLKSIKVDVGGGKFKTKLIEDSHLCFVLRQEDRREKGGEDGGQKRFFYRVLPLALGSAGPDGALTKWNKASLTAQANAPEANKEKVAVEWPVIEPFEHALHLDHNHNKLLLYFKPTEYAPVRSDDKDSDRTYGTVLGQRVMDRGSGDVLEVPAMDQTDKNGNPCFALQVFRIVQFSDNAIGVIWIGPASEVNLKRGALKFEEYRINGFDALGLDTTTANPQTVQDLAQWFAKGVLDDGNLLYAYAFGRGEVYEGQKPFEVRNTLRQVGKNAADQVQSELKIVKDEWVAQFTNDIKPDLAEMLAGGDIAEVWYRESGDDDVVAKWISERIKCDFRWDSWLHTRLRVEVLRMIAVNASISAPARSKKEVPPDETLAVELPAQVEQVPAEEVAAGAAEETVPAEADKPKRARSGNSRKKKDTAQAPVA